MNSNGYGISHPFGRDGSYRLIARCQNLAVPLCMLGMFGACVGNLHRNSLKVRISLNFSTPGNVQFVKEGHPDFANLLRGGDTQISPNTNYQNIN